MTKRGQYIICLSRLARGFLVEKCGSRRSRSVSLIGRTRYFRLQSTRCIKAMVIGRAIMGTTNLPPAASASRAKEVSAATDAKGNGLSSEEARRRLQRDGPNEMPDTALHPLRRALGKFWAPVPW